MIQRKQTVYLVFAIILLVLTFIFPFASLQIGTNNAGNVSILALQFFETFDVLTPFFEKYQYLFILMQILATLFISLCGVAIFMYKKRSLQIKLCAFAFITNVLLIGALFLTGTLIEKVEGLNLKVEYLMTAYLPIITMALVMLAQRAIRKDDAMVKSLNRIR